MRTRIGSWMLLCASACTFGSGNTDGGAQGDATQTATAGTGETQGPDEGDTSGGGAGGSIGDTTGASPLDTAGDAESTVGNGSTTGDTTGASESTGTPPLVCGDGLPGPDEACDDGDEFDANGCTTQCQVSGSLVWATQVDGSDSNSEGLWGVVFNPVATSYFAAGWRRNLQQDDDDALLVRVDPMGAIESEQSTAQPFHQSHRAITLGSGGLMALATRQGVGLEINEVDDTGSSVNSAYTGGGDGTPASPWAVAYGPAGYPLVGGTDGFGGSRNAFLVQPSNPDWSSANRLTINNGANEQILGLVWSAADDSYWAAYNREGAASHLFRYDTALTEQGDITIATPDNLVLRAVTATAEGLVTCGWSFNADQYTAHAYAFSFAGVPSWSVEWTGDATLGAYAMSVAADEEGNLVIAGAEIDTVDADTPFRPAVRKLDPTDGSLLWNTIVDVPGAPSGFLYGVTVGPSNRVVAVGGASSLASETNPLIVSLNP